MLSFYPVLFHVYSSPSWFINIQPLNFELIRHVPVLSQCKLLHPPLHTHTIRWPNKKPVAAPVTWKRGCGQVPESTGWQPIRETFYVYAKAKINVISRKQLQTMHGRVLGLCVQISPYIQSIGGSAVGISELWVAGHSYSMTHKHNCI